MRGVGYRSASAGCERAREVLRNENGEMRPEEEGQREERDREVVCVCVCVGERERERERERA